MRFIYLLCVRYGAEISADTNMSDLTEMTPIIERGLALHKMIRFVLMHVWRLASLLNHVLIGYSYTLWVAKVILTLREMNLVIQRSGNT